MWSLSDSIYTKLDKTYTVHPSPYSGTLLKICSSPLTTLTLRPDQHMALLVQLETQNNEIFPYFGIVTNQIISLPFLSAVLVLTMGRRLRYACKPIPLHKKKQFQSFIKCNCTINSLIMCCR